MNTKCSNRFQIVSALGLVLIVGQGTALSSSETGEIASTIKDQQAVAVTIYNENLAMVKDQRVVTLGSGFNRLAYGDVSALIKPETALLSPLSGEGGLSVIEQNFDFDLLTPAKLLEKYVGGKVGLVKVHPATGAETVLDATVLSAGNGVVLKVGDTIETGIPGRLVYRDIPPNLRARPTLVIQLDNETSGPRKVELSYLTGGLSWKADYVAELDGDDRNIGLTGWVTLTNTSGTSYNKTKLQLVAGDVHRVAETDYLLAKKERRALPEALSAPKMTEQSLFEYHLYTLDRPTTISENQTKQVALLSASGIPISKEFLLRGADYYYRSSYGDLGQKMKVGVFMEFENRESSRLGMPLPKGTVRVYKRDDDGNAQFVGEDRIDHTPKNEKVRLKLGDAFDVTADKKQTDFKRLPKTDKYDYTYEAAFQIDIKNAKKEAVVVKVQEPVPGDWEVREETHPHKKEASGVAAWKVKVPAEGKATLKYRVIVRF